VGAHKIVRRRGYHIFSRQLAHRWRWGCQPYARSALYLQEDSCADFKSIYFVSLRIFDGGKHFLRWHYTGVSAAARLGTYTSWRSVQMPEGALAMPPVIFRVSPQSLHVNAGRIPRLGHDRSTCFVVVAGCLLTLWLWWWRRCSSETSDNVYQTIRGHIPGDSTRFAIDSAVIRDWLN
jgi:hypothetical protein